MKIKIEYVEIDKIKPYGNNTKYHYDKQIKELTNSIKEFGFTQPIVLDINNTIIIGHCRYMAAKKLKLSEVPCIYIKNLSKQKVKALRLIDNKLNESEWNLGLLKCELDEITELEMDNFGFIKFIYEETKNIENNLSIELKQNYSIILECNNEKEQNQLYNEFSNRGYKCRLLTL